MQRQSNHDDGSKVHAVVLTHPRLPPVTLTYTMAGAGAMFADAHAVRQSLPQNVATFQGGNHAILGTCAEDTDRRLHAVAAGDVGGVGDGARGSEAGQ